MDHHSTAHIAMQLLLFVAQLVASPRPTEERGVQVAVRTISRGMQSAQQVHSVGLQAGEPPPIAFEAAAQTEYPLAPDAASQTEAVETRSAGLQTADTPGIRVVAVSAATQTSATLSPGAELGVSASAFSAAGLPDGRHSSSSCSSNMGLDTRKAPSPGVPAAAQVELMCSRCQGAVDLDSGAVCVSCFESKAARCCRCLAVPVAFEGSTCSDCAKLTERITQGVRRGGGFEVLRLPEPGSRSALAEAPPLRQEDSLHEDSSAFGLGTYTPCRATAVNLADRKSSAPKDWVSAENGQRLYRVLLPSTRSPARTSSRPSSARLQGRRPSNSHDEEMEALTTRINCLAARALELPRPLPGALELPRPCSGQRDAMHCEGSASVESAGGGPVEPRGDQSDMVGLRTWLAERTAETGEDNTYSVGSCARSRRVQ